MKKIKAIFKGFDGSLGYRNGHSYTLLLRENSIEREDGFGACVYTSVESFLNNWILKTQ